MKYDALYRLSSIYIINSQLDVLLYFEAGENMPPLLSWFNNWFLFLQFHI